jgi:hypothetical protein
VVVVAHELVGIATPYSAEVVLVYLLRARSREVPHFVDAVSASGLVEWLVRAVGAEETSPVEVCQRICISESGRPPETCKYREKLETE